MLVEVFRMCRWVKVSGVNWLRWLWEAGGFSKSASISTSSCFFHAFSPSSFISGLLHFSHLCHPPSLFCILGSHLYHLCQSYLSPSISHRIEVIHWKKAVVWTWRVLRDEQGFVLFCVSFFLLIAPISYLTLGGQQGGAEGVAAPFFKLLAGSVSCFSPVWTAPILIRNMDV